MHKQSAEQVDVLREAYERALVKYEGICAALNRHALAGTRPSDVELERERLARAELDTTRALYLEAWLAP